MRPKRILWLTLQLVVVIVLLSLVVGHALGQPVLLSYVTSDSMEPAISSGDGFVVLPAEIAGTPSTGDVVVFESEQVGGERLTTHRIVADTDRGYITQGDSNLVTDQDGGAQPIQEAEVVAVAWQPTGGVLTIPGLGTAVSWTHSVLEALQVWLAGLLGTDALLGVQGLSYLLFGLSVVLYLLLGYFDNDRQDDTRSQNRDAGTSTRLIAVGFALLVVSGATAAMVIPAGSQEYNIVSAEFESENPTTIQQGTTDTLQYPVNNAGFVPTVVMLDPETEGLDTSPDKMVLEHNEVKNASVAITTPPETGLFRYFVTEYRYLQILPPAVIGGLYDVHPWLPLVVINAFIGVPFYLLSLLLLGGSKRLRSRETNRRSSGWLP